MVAVRLAFTSPERSFWLSEDGITGTGLSKPVSLLATRRYEMYDYDMTCMTIITALVGG